MRKTYYVYCTKESSYSDYSRYLPRRKESSTVVGHYSKPWRQRKIDSAYPFFFQVITGGTPPTSRPTEASRCFAPRRSLKHDVGSVRVKATIFTSLTLGSQGKIRVWIKFVCSYKKTIYSARLHTTLLPLAYNLLHRKSIPKREQTTSPRSLTKTDENPRAKKAGAAGAGWSS